MSWKASLAVTGMVCSSCSKNIEDALGAQDWVTYVKADALSHTATVEFNGKENADRIVNIISDVGYDAFLSDIASTEQPEESTKSSRTLQVKIDGFHCESCPDKVLHAAAALDDTLQIVATPTDGLFDITYVPRAPAFTIRQILAAIDASDPAFKASIYHPPTAYEHAKKAQIKHRTMILRRVFTLIALAVPTFVIGIVYMTLLPMDAPGREYLMGPWVRGVSRGQLALLVLATPAYVYGADVFHRAALKEFKNLWKPGSKVPMRDRFLSFGSMNMLASLGTTVAYVSSVGQIIATLAHNSGTLSDSDIYLDTVVFLTVFILVGRLIESYSKTLTSDAVEKLGKLRPTEAMLIETNESNEEVITKVEASLLDFGDIVRIPSGSSPPCDGKVHRCNEASFDESSLTGESRSVKKSVGDDVYAGTVNNGDVVDVKITGTAGKTMLDQIVRIVQDGQARRAPIEVFGDLITGHFVPAITLIALVTFMIWLALAETDVVEGGSSQGTKVAFALRFAIAVFVASCPCGIGLAAPTAVAVGSGIAAKNGILVKGGGEAFQKASRIDCVVFDKTGTLTTGGEPQATDHAQFPAQGGEGEEQTTYKDLDTLLAVLRSVEESSSHPMAKAIVAFCKAKTDQRADAHDVEERPGRGLRGAYTTLLPEIDSFELVVGNEAHVREHATIAPAVAAQLDAWKREAKSVALVATRPRGQSATAPFHVDLALAVTDPIRPEAAYIVSALRNLGVDVWMLSGDNAVTARAVASRVGIPEDNVIAEVLPTEKASKIRAIQAAEKRRGTVNERATVAMVGDGINDAPALTVADVGIAIGSGSDVAISSADFVLVRSELLGITTLIRLSKRVFGRITTNYGWAVVYNVLIIPLAAGAFWSVRKADGQHVQLDPVWASLAMALSSISVVLSSLALRSRLPGLGFRV